MISELNTLISYLCEHFDITDVPASLYLNSHWLVLDCRLTTDVFFSVKPKELICDQSLTLTSRPSLR